jgi:phage recombination protein Bet
MKNEVAVKGVNYVEYESPYGIVQLDTDIVKNHLTKGNAKITDSEVMLFLELCKRQKLDPFVTGEVFLIKYKEGVPAQTVVGYNTYKRRAEENPNYLGKEEGIVVLRGNDIVKKDGACLYPQEKLLGGWCKVSYLKNGYQVYSYKECEMSEYRQDNTMWRTKPAMMICKVAVSQALRDAFPKEMNGLYTAEELAPKEAKEEDFALVKIGEKVMAKVSVFISEADRKKLFAKVKNKFGEKEGTEWLKAQVMQFGVETTSKLTEDNLKVIYENLNKDSEPIEEDVIELDDTVQCVLDVVEEEARKDK